MRIIQFLTVLLLLAFAGCSLNSDQEKSLNDAMSKYLKSRNEEQLMAYIAYTHPNAVAYYLAKGDSAFKKRFTIVNDEGFAPYLQDGNIREIKKEGNKIHVRYAFLLVTDDYYEVKGEDAYIYAISEDEGNSWYFIDEKDYLNNEIVKAKERLIDPND